MSQDQLMILLIVGILVWVPAVQWILITLFMLFLGLVLFAICLVLGAAAMAILVPIVICIHLADWVKGLFKCL